MRGQILKDWTKVNWRDPASVKKVFGALQHYMREPITKPDLRAAMQHYATSGDFPTSVLSAIKKYEGAAVYDSAWEDVFDVIDFTSYNRNGFTIDDVDNGLTFRLTLRGEKADIYKMAGDQTTVTFQRYSGGLGWDRALIDDEEYWRLEYNANAFRNKAYYRRSVVAYALIDAITSAQNLAWQAVTPAGVANTTENCSPYHHFDTSFYFLFASSGIHDVRRNGPWSDTVYIYPVWACLPGSNFC